MRKKIYIHDNWQVEPGSLFNEKNLDNPSLKKLKNGLAVSVPGTIHTDLLAADLLPDPFFADNEKKADWIHLTDWIYTTSFDLPEKPDPNNNVYLVFEGLDTIAKIELNGSPLGDVENMFRTYRFLVNENLRTGVNELRIYFNSPIHAGLELNKQFGKLDAVRFEERVYLRKAQYSFGWDWGPSLPTVGIWRPVYLEYTDKAMIDTVLFDTLELNKNEARVRMKIDVLGDLTESMKIKASLSHQDQTFEIDKNLSGSSQMQIEMTITDPYLWWPNGHGNQPLYNLHITLNDKNIPIDEKELKVGIRTIQLIHQQGGEQVFEFKVNNHPVYMKGANWIPSDSFIPRIRDDIYKELLTLAKESGMNMIRVWGGGIYEQPIFYEVCDQLGLLVWQDFMFACAAYPENDFFIKNIREEVRENVAKLQHHPSLAIWCGNNENEWIWYRQQKGTYKNMPGYNIFHHEIPKIVSELDPLRPYWPTSPFGEDEDPNDIKSGNRHSWHIWSYWVDYSEVVNDKSLFVTEFGFQGPANLDTLNSVLSKDSRNIQSELFEYHNKQIEGNERLIRFLAGHLPVKTEWDDFIYLTQLNQGLALKTCLEHWRFRWPQTAGSIIWQLNDCWPVTSWSLIDSFLKPKLSYYFVKNSFAPLSVDIKEHDDGINNVIINDHLTDFSGKIKILLLDLKNQQELVLEESDVVVKSGEKLGLQKTLIKDLPNSRNWIIIVTLYDDREKMVYRNHFAGKRWKYLKLPLCNVKTEVKENKKITLTSEKAALFVDLYHKNVRFSDRGMIILANETITLDMEVSKGKQTSISDVKVYTLNDYFKSEYNV